LSTSLKDGRELLNLARLAIERSLKHEGAPSPKELARFPGERGVFVTLLSTEGGGRTLRGCIGFPYPVMQLGEAVAEAAVAAASEDPRFPPLQPSELSRTAIEVSVLTVPAEINCPDRRELPGKVTIGKDGLIASSGRFSGLLLPQVAVEYRMGPDEFLSNACVKAGLDPEAWLDPAVHILSFQADVFAEDDPGGRVQKVKLEAGP
jgi:uncharacterized protein